MGKLYRLNYSVMDYFDEIKSRIVAASGRASDRFHVGKLILQGLKDAPEFESQIDAYTGESETAGSVLERSVRCATCFRTLGLGCGDVVAILAPNHLDVCVPFYATQYLGITAAPIDRSSTGRYLENAFNNVKPKVIFCQNEKFKDVHEALLKIKLEAKVVSFDESDKCMTFKQFHDKYENFETIDAFKPADFDTQNTFSFCPGSSGSTGQPKSIALTHTNMTNGLPFFMCMFDNFPMPTRLNVVFSPNQWMTAAAMFILSPILRFTRLQTSFPLTFSADHIIETVNKYKPTFTIVSATFMHVLMNSENRKDIDLSSFEVLNLTGSTVTQDNIDQIKALSPGTQTRCSYGMTECGCVMLNDDIERATSMKGLGNCKYRLVDPNTGMDVEEPNVQGELWISGPSVFRGYNNDPESIKDTFSADGWFRSGDIFYRDENWNYYFADRMNMFLDFVSDVNLRISPLQVENVIRKHPGVMDVAVTGVPHAQFGEVPMAFVVPRKGYDISAKEINQTVIDNLPDHNQLRGGVEFVSKLPLTANNKVSRKEVKEMALKLKL